VKHVIHVVRVVPCSYSCSTSQPKCEFIYCSEVPVMSTQSVKPFLS